MALAPGTRIGVYEIVSPLGEGGMGVVYRARDTKLDRQAALKLLPDAFAHDQERLARFEREAKTLASLNHPHIAHVYGVEETDSSRALAMELVEGEDLSARIRRGPIPVDEALPIARQIAEALEAAHEAGIVHRDLKPANIKVRDDGTVKVLDFGLAKTMEPAVSSSAGLENSPTITTPAMTMRGVILGTAAYMSPEQAKGKALDKRADIWAFGCVLYEMLTGTRAFGGDDVSDTLASVLRAEPDWKLLQTRSTPAVTGIVRRCLTRDLRERTHDIADVRLQLDDLKTTESPAVAVRRRPTWLPALSGLAAGLMLAAAGIPFVAPGLDRPSPMRISILVPEGHRLHRGATFNRMAFALSPDGQKLAAVLLTTDGIRRVYVRRLDDTVFNPVAGSDGAVNVFWAPDSRRLGIMTPGGVKATDLSGSTSVASVTLPGYVSASWANGDRIIATVGLNRPLFEWTVGDTVARERPTTLSTTNRVSPDQFLESGGLVYAVRRGTEIAVVGEDAKGVEALIVRVDAMAVGQLGVTARNGHLLLASTERSGRSQLSAQPFDVGRLTLSGEPTLLATDVNPHVSASANGIVAFSHANDRQELAWVDEQGRASSRIDMDLPISNMDLSADDRMVAIQDPRGLRVHDLSRGVTTQIASEGSDPVWSNDQRLIAFGRSAAPDMGIFVAPANGGQPRLVFSAKVPTYVDGWSADGKWLAGHQNAPGIGILIPLFDGAQSIIFGEGLGGTVDEPRFSPDGKWLAFGLNAADTGSIFVIPFPPTGDRWQVSAAAGGAQPRWRPDGQGLYFLSMSGSMMMVDFDGKPSVPVIGPPREIFKTDLTVSIGLDQYAVSRDGKRFLFRRPRSTARDQIELIVNWPALVTANQQ